MKKIRLKELLLEELGPASACDRATEFKAGTRASVITVILVLLQ